MQGCAVLLWMNVECRLCEPVYAAETALPQQELAQKVALKSF